MASRSATFSMQFDAPSGEPGRALPLLRRFASELRGKTPAVLLSLLCSAASAWAFAQVPRAVSDLIDYFVSRLVASFLNGAPTADSAAVARLLLPLCAAVLASALFSCLADTAASSFTSAAADTLRQRAFRKQGEIRVGYYDLHAKSETLDTVTSQIDLLNQSLGTLLTQTVPSACLLAAILIMIFRKYPVAGMIASLILPLQILLRQIISLRENAARESPASTLPEIGELYANADLLLSAGTAPTLRERLSAQEKARAANARRSRMPDAFRKHTPAFFATCAIAGALAFGAGALQAGDVTIGALLSIFIYIRRLEDPAAQCADADRPVRQLGATLRRIYAFLDAETEDLTEKPLPPIREEGNRVVFDRVDFRYPASPGDVIRNCSMTLPDRGVTVLAGATAAGKTTLIKLLLRLYRPFAGTVSLNGVPVEETSLRAYRDLFSVIPQEAELLALTARENISYPEKTPDEARLRRVSALLRLDGVVGLDEAETAKLSSGQKQMLLLARAVYHERRYLILDESFSHVDADYEAFLIARLKELARTRGVVVISHRPGILAAADQIIDVAERGGTERD